MNWQNLIRDWLRRTAEQRLREAMAAAAQNEDASPEVEPSRKGGGLVATTAHVGIVMPEHREAVGLIDRLDGLLTIEADRAKVFEGGLNGKRLALIVCGAPEAAGEATEVLIDGHGPNVVISSGFGTALQSNLSPGDLFLAERIVVEGSELPLEAPDIPSRGNQPAWHRGRLLSPASIPSDASARQALAEPSAPQAAVRHAAAVAVVARTRNLRCAALCVIRHGLGEQTSRDLERLRRQQPWSRKIGLLTGMALGRPGSIKSVLSEKEHDLIMADRLADGIAALIKSLTHTAALLCACGVLWTLLAAAAPGQDVQPPPLLPLPPEAVEQLQSDIPPPVPQGETQFPSETVKSAAPAAATPPAPTPATPDQRSNWEDHDFSAAGLRAASHALLTRYGGDPRQVPLAEKAEFLESVLWRYHRNPYGQIATGADLPTEPGFRPRWPADSDTSTWNGVLLSAWCWKYAVTKDPETLKRITMLLDGLEVYTQVTGKSGCYARCVALEGDHADPSLQKFGIQRSVTAAGEPLTWIGDPAKGTYNQLAGGYATLMLHAYDDLPAERQRKARRLSGDLVMHLLDGGYKIRRPDGQPTTYGDLTPLVATVGIPFNAQVTYLIVALGEQYPPADAGQKGSIEHQFYRLRAKHHAYYANPWKNPVRPQRVGSNPLVKGMNDRFHLMTAAYHSLTLEMARAAREKRELDRTFMYRMGLSLVWTMRTIGGDRNALCNFMYAGMLNDPQRLDMIVEAEERGEATFQTHRGVADGLEQLRRYPLDRFRRPGSSQPTEEPQWIDAQRPDDFHWKADPKLRFVASGPATNNNVAAIDFLAAYWLMRLHALDRHPAAAPHTMVLGR